MIKILINHNIFLFILGITLFLFTSCSEDETENLTGAESELLGKWTIVENGVMIDFSVGEQTFVEYLIDFGGLSEQEAEEFYNDYMEEIKDELDIGGTIEFKSDYTYVSIFPGDDPDSGTWKLSSDGKTITLDENDPDLETLISINSLAGNTMNITFSEPIDEDEEFFILMEVTIELTR